MNCSENYVTVNGVSLCWFEWGSEFREEGTILLVHATGFHARCWDQVVNHLSGKNVIAIDVRGHGRSDKTPPFNWDAFGADLVEFLAKFELNNIVGVGHSMGGHVVSQTAANDVSRFTRLLLIDPVIVSPEAYVQHEEGPPAWFNDATEHPVARRKNYFADADAMFNNLHGRSSYAVWRDDVLRDYCEYGLNDNPEGDGYVLSCPPEIEASIYIQAAGTNISDQIRHVDIPVRVLRAKPRDPNSMEMDFTTSPTWPELASQFKLGTDVFLPELTHFMPMQDPALIANHILHEKMEV
ncbi:MAG: alpha/beta hydrolase [Gammaproteobacteria bacterium]|jgi:pimeloyl-ACP methyl ester carboxylesterase|nr:alpha/beta hydrolase [Gammaproteobacteria bacterium]|tara:strand:- start:11694 stop:12581 length:888 start_codon:yes stop_codon:yes gene_type:complete